MTTSINTIINQQACFMIKLITGHNYITDY
jgi:hypothetical protein